MTPLPNGPWEQVSIDFCEVAGHYAHLFTIYHLFIYFKDLFTERACPQLAKANLGGPCLNKQITKEKKKYIYIQTKIN